MGNRGLTLAELVLAVGLLTLLLLGCARLFMVLLAGSNKSNATSVGVQLAEAKLEELVAATSTATSAGVLEAYTVDASTQTRFFYQASVTPLSGDVTSSSRNYLGGYLIRVDCWWNSSSPKELRPGVGLQTVHVERFFYPRRRVP